MTADYRWLRRKNLQGPKPLLYPGAKQLQTMFTIARRNNYLLRNINITHPVEKASQWINILFEGNSGRVCVPCYPEWSIYCFEKLQWPSELSHIAPNLHMACAICPLRVLLIASPPLKLSYLSCHWQSKSFRISRHSPRYLPFTGRAEIRFRNKKWGKFFCWKLR